MFQFCDVFNCCGTKKSNDVDHDSSAMMHPVTPDASNKKTQATASARRNSSGSVRSSSVGSNGSEGRRLGGSDHELDAKRTDLSATAAMRRQSSTPGFSAQTSKSFVQGDRRAREVAKIERLCRELGDDVPLAVPTLGLDQLTRYRERLELQVMKPVYNSISQRSNGSNGSNEDLNQRQSVTNRRN
jgi:hypothetical protein